MPYALSRREDPKTGSSQYCVVRSDTGKPVPGGCHGARPDALRHLNAIEANVPEAHREITPLTDQEKIIVRYLVAGLARKQIAFALILSPETVRTHAENIHRKLQVENRSSMIIKVLVSGIIGIDELPSLCLLAEQVRHEIDEMVRISQ